MPHLSLILLSIDGIIFVICHDKNNLINSNIFLVFSLASSFKGVQCLDEDFSSANALIAIFIIIFTISFIRFNLFIFILHKLSNIMFNTKQSYDVPFYYQLSYNLTKPLVKKQVEDNYTSSENEEYENVSNEINNDDVGIFVNQLYKISHPRVLWQNEAYDDQTLPYIESVLKWVQAPYHEFMYKKSLILHENTYRYYTKPIHNFPVKNIAPLDVRNFKNKPVLDKSKLDLNSDIILSNKNYFNSWKAKSINNSCHLLHNSKDDIPSCPICLDNFDKGHLLWSLPSCPHTYHKECIVTWLTKNPSCPNCRSSIFYYRI